MKPHKEQALDARSTPASPLKKGSSGTSIRCTPSGKLVKHTSEVSRAKAGDCARLHIMTAAFPARRWSVPRSNSC
jgi:hypothetical protein